MNRHGASTVQGEMMKAPIGLQEGELSAPCASPKWTLLLELLAHRVEELAGVDDVGVEVAPVVGKQTRRAAVQHDQRLELRRLAEGAGDPARDAPLSSAGTPRHQCNQDA